MRKKEYDRPSMQVFELKQQPQLLVGSATGGMDPLSPFAPADDPDPLNP
jgi:hypothetical protein